MMPESLRHRLAWQQHFLEEGWVLESYSTEEAMPRTAEQLSQLSARLSNSDRCALCMGVSHDTSPMTCYLPWQMGSGSYLAPSAPVTSKKTCLSCAMLSHRCNI